MQTMPIRSPLPWLKDTLVNKFALRDETYSFLDNPSTDIKREEVKKRAYHDVEELERTIREIRTTFVDVDENLTEFDKVGFRDQDKKDLQFGQEWKEMMRRFEDILRASHENAKFAVAILKDLSFILGKDVDTKQVLICESLKGRISGILERVDEQKQCALDNKRRFQSLADDVRLFSGRIELVLQQANEGLNVVDARDLLRFAKMLGFSTNKKAGFFTKLKVAAGLLLFSPLLMKCVAWMKVFQYQCSAMIFGVVKPQIEQLIRQTDTFVNIWQTIQLDLLSIHESLEKNLSGRARITKFFWVKMMPIREVYEDIAGCLDSYVKRSA